MAAPMTTATYDLPVLNAMLEVESFFQEMLCEAYGVENEDDLPGDIPDVDVVKFAELSDEAVHGILRRALTPHPFKKSGVTIDGVVGATLEKIATARNSSGAKWPARRDFVDDDDAADEAKDDYVAPPLEHARSVHMPEGPTVEAHEASGRHVVTAHYDLKTMNRIQQINNKFNDELVALYRVGDEDDLPPALTDITFGDVIVNDHWDTNQICQTLRKALDESPWPGMQASQVDTMLNQLGVDLLPFVQKMSDEVSKK